MHIFITLVIIFGKLNGIPTRKPLGFYNYPNTNSFVNNYPEVRFADPRIAEFCRLYPDKANFIWFSPLLQWVWFFSLSYPT